ncbi:hypothetical protein C8R47DRAFT_1321958 [Mycena vitilis]|nr:hypothetical protein C8R47DRAFT_1321958 [Mycena vitilis]
MSSPTRPPPGQISAIVAAAGPDSLSAYVAEVFPPALVALGYYTAENANSLGAYLVTRNLPHLSGIHEKDPKLILEHILWTCIFHVERKFTQMALIVPDEIMGRIRRCVYLKTQQEMDAFVAECKQSEYKVVRDWIADKDSIPWFFPSINGNLSKIPEDDWYLTPGDTNLNESAHPFTNQHTGTNLSILEAVDSAYEMDLNMEAKLRAMETSCVLVNHLNSKVHRDRNNVARRNANHDKAIERSEASNELENIDTALEKSAALTKELREKRKALQLESGVKKTKKQGEKAKVTYPDVDELAGAADNTSALSSPVRPVLHLAEQGGSGALDVQLDADLEPLRPSQYVQFVLPGDLDDYFPFYYPNTIADANSDYKASDYMGTGGGGGGKRDSGQWKWKSLSGSGRHFHFHWQGPSWKWK